jgi:hypothetical protein
VNHRLRRQDLPCVFPIHSSKLFLMLLSEMW